MHQVQAATLDSLLNTPYRKYHFGYNADILLTSGACIGSQQFCILLFLNCPYIEITVR